MEIKELIEKRCKQYGNLCSSYGTYTLRITPAPVNYRACWYHIDVAVAWQNNITSDQAATAIEHLEEWVENFEKKQQNQ